MAEQAAHNRWVPGSSPGGATTEKSYFKASFFYSKLPKTFHQNITYYLKAPNLLLTFFVFFISITIKKHFNKINSDIIYNKKSL